VTTETPEQVARAQEQIENFFHLAPDVQIAVEALEDAFCGLADFPEAIGEAMPQLSAAAHAVAGSAQGWAMLGNYRLSQRK
jgi:hypothetical protein